MSAPTTVVAQSGAATADRATPEDFLRVLDLGRDGLHAVLDAAADVKARPEVWRGRHAGGTVVCLFDKPSTRTRVSTAVAAHRLGLLPVLVSREDSQLSRGETIEDTGRVLSAYADAIVIRTHAHETLSRLACAASVPVVNALSDDHHPCQALADALTLREHFGRLAGLRVAYVGDAYSNICHSLIEVAVMTGMRLTIAAPAAYHPDPAVLAGARAAGGEGTVTVVENPAEALRDAHAVYPEIWVPMDKEHLRAEREADLRRYRVGDAEMALAGPDAVLLHCLPAYRGREVSAQVLDGPRSVVWQQAANRLPTAQAVLHLLLAGSYT
ncbi:ornithine carbamoyltransferase [Micromonospora sp. RP3T]|uniref:ornithine carbamoyltransferase n=1 Tax=Micromonospora sp. RP3T TaxID=2135446 RepID=UPI003D730BFE